MVVAAFTVTCWPRIARRPISNPLKAPGTRMPGFALTAEARRASLPQMFRDHVGPRVEIEQRPDAAEQRRQHGREAVRELDHQRVLLRATASP